MHKPGLVVVGSGPAGLSAAETFRRHHPGIPVYVLTADAALPYARPPLSKEFLRGEQTDVGLHPQGWFDAAEEKPGSWWPDWDAWMKRHSNGTIPAPAQQGNVRFNPIEPAPGRYVMMP